MKLLPLILPAVLFGACAGDAGIQTEFNPTVDFTQFRSFSFAEPNVQAQEGSIGHDPRLLETIFETIQKDLSARSMQPVESGADLSIAISIAVGEEMTMLDGFLPAGLYAIVGEFPDALREPRLTVVTPAWATRRSV